METEVAKQKSEEQPDEGVLREAAEQLSPNPEKAGRSLPAKDREAFRESQESVDDARRSAETREGLLQIN